MYLFVDYGQLQTSAASLMNEAQNYAALVTRIHSAMEATQNAWQGSDAQAFVSKAQSLHPQLMRMQDIIHTYANALNQSASVYETVQAQRAASTACLA